MTDQTSSSDDKTDRFDPLPGFPGRLAVKLGLIAILIFAVVGDGLWLDHAIFGSHIWRIMLWAIAIAGMALAGYAYLHRAKP